MLSICSQICSTSLNLKIQSANRFSALCRAFGFSLLLLLASSLPGETLARCVAMQDEPGNHQDFLDIKKDYVLSIRDECIKKSTDPAETQQAFLKLHNAYLGEKLHSIKVLDRVRLNRDAKAFLDLKPQEPFSRIAAGLILIESNLNRNILENCKMIEKAAGQMKDYSLEARLYAAAAVHKTVSQANFRQPKETSAIFKNYLDLLIEWMTQEDSPEHLQRLMYEKGLGFVQWSFADRDMLSPFLERVEAAEGQMKPWLRNMLLAASHERQAWNSRGSGFANTVSENGWTQFRKGMKLAEQELKTAYGLNPERPEAAGMMIGIARAGETDEDGRTWFDRSVKAEFDYMPAYDNYLPTLYPRWGGSHESMVEFGIECAGTERYDTRVPFFMTSVFYKVYRDSSERFSDESERQAFLSYIGKFNFYSQIQEICENYDAYIKETDGFTVTDARYYRGISFAIAYRLGQFKDAYDLIKKYRGDVLTPDSPPDGVGSTDVAIARVYAANGAAAEQANAIEEQTNQFSGMQRTFEESKTLLSEIEEAAALNDFPEAELFFQTKKELVTKEVEYHEGDWVDLKFTPDMRHWSNYGGRYKVESPTSVLAVNSDREKQHLYYNTSFAGPYEVELTVQGVTPHYYAGTLAGGLICGQMYGPRDGRFFWADTPNGTLGQTKPGNLLRGAWGTKTKSVCLLVTASTDYIELSNGKNSTKGSSVSDFRPLRIGIGLTPWVPLSGEVRYSDIRIRKLDFSDAPAGDDPEGQVAYYTKRLQEKKSFHSFVYLGVAYVQLQKYKEALKAFKLAQKIDPDSVDPTLNVGVMMTRIRRYDKASTILERALEQCVGSHALRRGTVLDYLVWLYATCSDAEVRDGDKAVKYAEEMLGLIDEAALTPSQYSAIAAAYAEAGQFKNAIKYVESGIETSEEAGESSKSLRGYLKLYQDGKPFHEK